MTGLKYSRNRARDDMCRVAFACIALAMGFVLGCAESEFDRVKRLAPDIPDDILRVILVSDETALREYAREVGMSHLKDAHQRLFRALSDESPEAFEETRRTLSSLIDRTSLVARPTIFPDRPLDAANYIDTVAADVGVRYLRLIREGQAVYQDSELTPVEKIDRLSEVALGLDAMGRPVDRASVRFAIANLYARIGDDSRFLENTLSAVDEFRRAGYVVMLCQSLGALGSFYEDHGDIDAMKACYDEALSVSLKARHAYQAARIYSFYAAHYQRRGQLALAHDMHLQAQAICRELNEGIGELRFVVRSMRFYAGIGAWGVVAGLMERARVLREQHAATFDSNQEALFADLEIMRGRYAMVTGDVGSAVAIFEATAPSLVHVPYDDRHAELLHAWAEGLLDNGRYREALPIIREGYRVAENLHLAEPRPKFLLLLAQAHFGLGNHNRARAILEQFDNEARSCQRKLRREWVERDALMLDLSVTAGDRHSAMASLNASLSRLEKLLAAIGPSAHAYLWLAECDDLRRAAHAVVGEDVELGYGLELFWGGLGEVIGLEKTPDLLPLERTRAIADHALRTFAEDGARHLVYRIQGNTVWRWSLEGGVLVRDALNVSAYTLKSMIQRVRHDISTDPGQNGKPFDDPAGRLRALAVILLPEGIAGDKAPVRITADGFLSQLPFETLNLSDNGYEPLLRHHEVVYVPYLRAAGAAPRLGSGLIVAPSIQADPLLAYTAGGKLLGAHSEGRFVAASFNNASLLSDGAATKSAVMNRWRGAPFIYVASHVRRDPEIPYLCALPMAPPARGESPDANVIQIRDIRDANLSNTSIVILSGCSSGTPYVGATGMAPAIGDAFIDAGAATVIQTFWDIRDDNAREFMTSFVTLWRSHPDAAAAALCQARRIAMRGPKGIRHPFYWAAYFAQTTVTQ